MYLVSFFEWYHILKGIEIDFNLWISKVLDEFKTFRVSNDRVRTICFQQQTFLLRFHCIVQLASWIESLRNNTRRNLSLINILTNNGPCDFVSTTFVQLFSEVNGWSEWENFLSHYLLLDIYILWIFYTLNFTYTCDLIIMQISSYFFILK